MLLLAVIGAAIFGVVALTRRGRTEGQRDDVAIGADVITYVLLAAAMLVLVFSVAALARAAFPNDPFVFEPERQVASALAAIAVSAPVSVILWIRQRKRRLAGGGIGGFTLYLTVIELVLGIALVVALSQTLLRLFTGTGTAPWTNLVVFLASLVFHEFAVRDTPLPRQAYEIPRTVGAAIGFVPLAAGLGGVLYEGFLALYDMVADFPGFGPGVLESLAFILTGLPLWWYRWIHRWAEGHGPMRRAWAIVVSVTSMSILIGTAAFTLAMTLVYLIGDTNEPAGSAFSFLPFTVALAVVAYASWQHHRSVLGSARTDAVRFYEYLLAAVGLVSIIGSLTALTTTVFSGASFVGDEKELAIVASIAALTAVGVWYGYWSHGQSAPRLEEAASTPRRLYLLVLGVITAITAAVSLISFLVMVFQAVLGVGGLSDAAVPVASLFVTSSLAAWHLLSTYASDRGLTEDLEDETAPFDVTVICSHPGKLSTTFPSRARVRVIYRDDDAGVVSDEMAEAIVAAVDGRSSFVWVDESGFRIAAAR